MKKYLVLLSVYAGMSTVVLAQKVDVEAHRGGIGLMPENTIAAMIHAVDLGVNTLEMDLSVSADRQLVVSHDPYMNRNFVTKPDGSGITAAEEKSLALYTMPYDSIRKYETGLRFYSKFPDQKKIKTHKPLISDLIDSVETYVKEKGLTPVHYNIEIKSGVKNDNVSSPVYTEFVDLAIPLLLSKRLGDRLVVQCFDVRALNYMHQKYPQLILSYLVGAKDNDLDVALGKLDFTPQVYSPNYTLVNAELVKQVHGKGMKILPWTVDEEQDITRMIELKVDGIISNYPNRVLNLVGKVK